MKKIFIVEDDHDLAKVLEMRLKTNGYEIFKATDGIEALAKIKELKPDLIVLDILMPVMDGYQLIRELQGDEQVRDIPVLVMTGRTDIKKEFDSIGIEHYLIKPFDPQVLLETVELCIRS